MNQKHILSCMTALMIVTLPSVSHSYNLRSCNGDETKWNSNNVTMRSGNNTFPSPAYGSALSSVITNLNRNPSNFTFSLVQNDTSVSMGNGQNEFWFSSSAAENNGAPAVTWTWRTCTTFLGFTIANHIDETDIVFNNGTTYTTSTSKNNLSTYNGTSRPFRTTAMHELGHAMGLLHEDGTYNIMGQDWDHIHTNGSTSRDYLGEDASNGAVDLYGLQATNSQDLGVVHWRRTGANGEYSTHARTRIFNTSGTELTKYTDNGEPRYEVYPGQTIKVEFSYENNGTQTQSSVPVGFYLSTNDFISTFDNKLASTSMSLGRNTVWTTQHSVTIPLSTTPGKYHIGPIIDDTSSTSEYIETNNATYTGIEVKPLVFYPIPFDPVIVLPKG